MSSNSSSNNTDKKDEQLHLYNDVLQLVEEEIYQRRNGSNYKGGSTKGVDDQTGGSKGFQTGGMVPGKFSAMRHSMELPLDIAIRGTIARQQLFMQENNF
jgi:hypothetical protein